MENVKKGDVRARSKAVEAILDSSHLRVMIILLIMKISIEVR